MMRWLAGLAIIFVTPVLLLLVLPAPIEPESWIPDPNPGFSGPFLINDQLASTEHLLAGAGEGPEDIACAGAGVLYTGFSDGRIIRIAADGSFTELANTGGRPLGMQLDASGALIVADGVRGLLSVTPQGDVSVLTDKVGDESSDTFGEKKILFADDLDIAGDGNIWFSDASMRHGYKHSMYNFLEGSRTGRLLRFNPATKETSVELDGLFFANGVALGPNDEYVLVNETGTGRIHRLWLRGSNAGQRDLFASELPGMPDNISFNGHDTFWVGMPGPRADVDAMASLPLLRKLLSFLPLEILGGPREAFSMVLGLGLDGRPKYNLQATRGAQASYHTITSANECDKRLYFGSISMSAIGRYLH